MRDFLSVMMGDEYVSAISQLGDGPTDVSLPMPCDGWYIVPSRCADNHLRDQGGETGYAGARHRFCSLLDRGRRPVGGSCRARRTEVRVSSGSIEC